MRYRDVGWVSDQVVRDGKCDGRRQRPVDDRDSEVCFIFVCSTDILQRREAFEEVGMDLKAKSATTTR